MLIRMNHSFYEELIQYCRSKLPNEACGFISGSVTDKEASALSFIEITNVSSQPRQCFEMNPSEMVHVVSTNSFYNQLIGVFHSHPTADAEPSQQDLLSYWHTLPTQWILSFQDPSNPVLQIYQIKKASPMSPRKLSLVIDQ